ncbi:MAG: asparagine synthase (glutamine-hydrolyzing) [Chloroflexota bacterium]|nr:MAG: asparagine synthase (glutamine-hydrolyzing) [Chloroflexota bacterium]
MCGIAGVFHYADPEASIDRGALERMTRCLQHRGPDDEGFFVEGPVAFGHRRLSIVDLSPTGRQPMQTPDRGFCITYNGELYNHAGFRSRLSAHGVTFRGPSDTETLLSMLAQYGPRILSEAAGIFALALWDRRARRLLLARDQLGVKQLYYHDDGRRVIFASEIKALFEFPGVPCELNPQGLNEYLHFHTPLFERTFFKGIRQVRPGEFVEVDHNGVRSRQFAENDGFEPRQGGPAETVADLRGLLAKVVAEQLMSDVPVGAFFSGGIDSSAVAAFAKRSGQRIRCFGIHFTHKTVIDERPYQEAAAKALGLELELTTVDSRGFPEDLMRLTWFQDQPVIGAALIPMFHVSRLAARHVKVCLGGQGADEIFGGYARYALAHPAHVLTSWFARRPGAVGAERQEVAVGGTLLKQLADGRNLRRLVRRLQPLESWSGRYFENFAQVPESLWREAFPDPAILSRNEARGTFDDALRRSPARTSGDKLLHWDIQTYLPGLFHQDDRMSMANSLESRVPIADPRVVRFALHTDFDLKLRGGATKWILRQAVSDVIPESVLNRRKVGFDTPAESWMREEHKTFVRDLLTSSEAKSRGYWNHAGVIRLLEDTGSPYWFDIVWKLTSIEAWARTFLDAPTVMSQGQLTYASS